MTAPTKASLRGRGVAVIGAVALVALMLGVSNVDAGTTSPALTIELTPSEAKIGQDVAVRVVGDSCAFGTTGELVDSSGAPDAPTYATVTFSDPNNGTFVVPDLKGMEGGGTDVVVECSSAQEEALSGRAAFNIEQPVNGFDIAKDVATEGGSTQPFGFAIDGPDEIHNWLVPLSDGGSDPDTFGARQIGVGTYTVSEAPTEGWTLTSITCDDEAAVVDVATSTVSFDLPEDGIVTCTFLNTQSTTPTTTPPATAPATAAAPAAAAPAVAGQANYTG